MAAWRARTGQLALALTLVTAVGVASPAAAPAAPDAGPVVTAMQPTTVDRGDVVTVTGSDLGAVDEATVHGYDAPFTVVDDTTVLVTVPEVVDNGERELALASPGGSTLGDGNWLTIYGPEVPYEPERVRVGSLGTHSATIDWAPLDARSWPATGYEATAWVGDEVVATQAVTERSATFTGLRAETTYTFSVVAVNEVGRSQPSFRRAEATPTGWGEAVRPPFTTLSAFLDRQWVDLVDRPPSPAEHALWLERLLAGTHLPGDVVAFLRRSNDHRRAVDPIVRLYRAFFERLPEPAGLAYWSAQRRSGTTIDQVARSFAASNEFRTLYGPLGNRAFVRRVYLNVLGREGDPTGVAYWTAELDAGRRTRGAVMVGFSESAENREVQAATVDVAVLYAGLLGRRPTTVQLEHAVEELDGGTPLATLATRILTGDEYRQRVSA